MACEENKIAIALIHYPIKNSLGEKISTNITNFDIHDIARVATVYDVDRYYIIHPLEDQRNFVEQVLEHWRTGKGAKYNPMRKSSLSRVSVSPSLEDAVLDWESREQLQTSPQVLLSSAKPPELAEIHGFGSLRRAWENKEFGNKMLVFGTGFGIHSGLFNKFNGFLEPIRGTGQQDYRHLSVRSAVTICLDRLFGVW